MASLGNKPLPSAPESMVSAITPAPTKPSVQFFDIAASAPPLSQKPREGKTTLSFQWIHVESADGLPESEAHRRRDHRVP